MCLQALCLCVSVSSPLLVRTPIIELRAQLSLSDLILTHYICKDPFSKEGHVLRFKVDVNLGGNNIQSTTGSLKAGEGTDPGVL